MPLCPAFALPTDSDHAAQSAASDNVLSIGSSPFVECTNQANKPAESKSSKLIDHKICNPSFARAPASTTTRFSSALACVRRISYCVCREETGAYTGRLGVDTGRPFLWVP